MRLFVLLATAVFIFASFHRGEARFRPAFWSGAGLLALGVTGAYPSLVATVHHRHAVFIAAFWPRPWDPRAALIGYLLSAAFGITLLLHAGRSTVAAAKKNGITSEKA